MTKYAAGTWTITSFFIFSSSRQHTRCYRDWSSDVCSSDLALEFPSVIDVFDGKTGADLSTNQDDIPVSCIVRHGCPKSGRWSLRIRKWCPGPEPLLTPGPSFT